MSRKNKRERKKYHAEYWKKYYSDPDKRSKHLTSVRKTDIKRIQKIREWIAMRKLELGCKVCGFREHSAALDFAHRDRSTKEANVASFVSKGWSLRRVQAEAERCDVLCANHHRIATYEENGLLEESGRPCLPV